MTQNEILILKANSPFSPLFEKIDSLLSAGDVILAVEGMSASGKTTLGNVLSDIYDCTVLHTDDFFLRPEQRTEERLAEAGGNVDRERFFDEVITPLCKKESIIYRRFDCSDFTLSEPVIIKPSRLTVIEGAYSMHPFFGKYYNLSVFLDISSEKQKERILRRNTPEQAQRFFAKWIPMENMYFETMKIKDKCDFVFFADS